jgi:TnpA family transposase
MAERSAPSQLPCAEIEFSATLRSTASRVLSNLRWPKADSVSTWAIVDFHGLGASTRFSSKYFGLKKGISSYTLVANHVPINARTIGTQEHESHYVFDMLYNNTTEIKPDRHSTDTHGTNQVNFWILHAFGYEFAPRYRDLHKKMSTLVGFEHLGQHGNALIKPARKVNEPLIRQEWPNVQRIMASLAQKDVTQATIVRKLSAYARQN